MTGKATFPLVAALLAVAAGGCTRHEVDVKPVEIKPIHITIDVNVKVDRALDDFFGDLDQQATETATTEGTAPATTAEGDANEQNN